MPDPQAARTRGRVLPRWAWGPLSLAAIKSALGICGYLATRLGALPEVPAAAPPGFRLLHLLVFALVGWLLVAASRRDPRAAYLGGVFILLSASTADALFAGLAESPSPALARGVGILEHLHPDAFLPLFVWLFFRDFPAAPEVSGERRPRFAFAVRLAAAASTALFVLLALPLVLPGALGSPHLETIYLYAWTTVNALSLPALVLALARARRAPRTEKRRVMLFLAGLLAGFAPMPIALAVLALFPATERRLIDLGLWPMVSRVLRAALISVPITTAYAVLVNRVLDVRLVIRRAVQHALARYTVLATAAIPIALLVAYLYRHRHQTLLDLLSGRGPLVLTAATVLGLLAIRLRGPALEAIDRRFFREQYDARAILASLVEKSRRIGGPTELAVLLTRDIDRALHVERIAVLLRNPANDLVSLSGSAPPLPASSALADLVSGQTEPLDVDPDPARSLPRRLGGEDRRWLAASGFRLLVPLIATEGTLLGLIALGPKLSELPHSTEDRQLLAAIAASAALTLENRMMIASPGRTGLPASPADADLARGAAGDDDPAGECISCHSLAPLRQPGCGDCGGVLAPAPVPLVLAGKFRLEKLLGSGGMGVVYRAHDLALGRRVAIKTLPRLDPDSALRLRREARAMAALSHPQLALIHGAETWRRTPMLVFEHLDGGTLHDRIHLQPLEERAAVELGVLLADGLAHIHAAGILHRDVKPSNIGFAAGGIPKLMDFGLAKILDDARGPGGTRYHSEAIAALATVSSSPATTQDSLTALGHMVGTPAYLSPEVLAGAAPGPELDLWALALTLYEAIAGRHPLLARTVPETMDRIGRGVVPDIRELAPRCSAPTAGFLGVALAADPAARPRTAIEFSARLRRLRDELPG